MVDAALAPASLPFHLYRPQRGHPDWARLTGEARALAEAIAEHAELPIRGWPRKLRRARAVHTALHNFAINRERHREGREDLRPLYFIWTLLRTCNFTCTYCDDHRGRKYPELSNEGVLDTAQARRLLEIMRTGTPSVYFAGGEPTLRKDLPELTRYARDLNYDPIIINTNGSLFDRLLLQPRWRTFLADIDVIVVSLDGLDLAALNQMWVTKRAEVVLRNLLALRELRDAFHFKLMVNTVIQPGQVHHARAVLDFANDLGIWFCPVPMNVGPRVHGALGGDRAYQELVELILERKQQGYRITGSSRLNQRLLRSAPLSCRNTLKPHVDYDGRLAWPCKASVNVEPDMIDVLQFNTVDELYAAAVERVNPTRFHGPAKNQCGADCNWAQNYTTDAYAHGLAHPLSLASEVLELLRAR